jgi:hypothetical protein
LQKQVEARYPSDPKLKHIVSCVQIAKEIFEFLDCAPWKFERENEGKSREVLMEEMVDIFKYYIRLLVVHNVTPEEFKKAFDKKSDIVERRLLDGKSWNACMEESLRESKGSASADNSKGLE